ncbi:MAG: alkaline phosphatase family protein, partial [Polyangiaceae bacterium]
MLLAISLSTNDYVGHSFGPDSWEAWDELLRLDAALAKFFAGLDTRFGTDGYAVVLSADHGVTTMPEVTLLPGARPWCAPNAAPDRWERACGKVGRLPSDSLADELRVAVRAELGEGDFVAGIADPYVYLTRSGRALAGEQRRKLDFAITTALTKQPEVDKVFARDAVPPTSELVFNSVTNDAGDYYVLVARGSFFDPLYVLGHGTSHGSPYLYDRAVPLLVRAPGLVKPGVVTEGPLTFRAFARAATDLLGIAPLESARTVPSMVTEKRKVP